MIFVELSYRFRSWHLSTRPAWLGRLFFMCLLFVSPSLYGASLPFKVETFVGGLENPWAVAFLPDGRILITERPGRLRVVEKGSLHPTPIHGLPEIVADGQGGLLDVALHPNYLQNGWIYFSYAAPDPDSLFSKSGTAVARAKLKDHNLVEWQVLYTMKHMTGSGRHFGSRLAFDKDNYLYITVGDRGERPRAQELSDSAGSVLRLHDDGSIPKDNPFVNDPKAHPAIYSYGHRNPQGMTVHPQTDEVWIHEHGPKGGDEINLIKAGINYGWPIITYGSNYVLGTKIGEGTHKAGMAQPIHQWTPSIAPSGMTFYTGDKFKLWQGSLFIGALKYQMLVRLELGENKVMKQELLLKDQLGRIRDVRTGDDGYLYLLIDSSEGKLVRLVEE